MTLSNSILNCSTLALFTASAGSLFHIGAILYVKTRKSTMTGTVALTGATSLPRHQPQKSIHFAWYRQEVDALTQPDISRADPREKPNFHRIRWRVATSEGSMHGRLGGNG